MRAFFLLMLGLALLLNSAARAEELCIYKDERGITVQTRSRDVVPEALRPQARCFESRTSSTPQQPQDAAPLPPIRGTPSNVQLRDLAAPQDIALQGNIRAADIASPLGRVQLRWPRSVEQLFGRTPERAMVEAARAVSRALKRGGFPPRISNLDLDWQVIFMDAELPAAQIPEYLRQNCHPAWMTPPANLYIVSQRVSGSCGGAEKAPRNAQVNDSQLAQVLMHEMGHAVEFHLLEGKGRLERMRAEGFATWFEQYASEGSTIVSSGKVLEHHLQLARESFKMSGGTFTFTGSAYDYARASLYFRIITARRGVPGLLRIYEAMKSEPLSFMAAVEKSSGMTRKQIEQEVLRLVEP